MTEPSRREFMGAVAALALTRYEDQDLDPADLGEWDYEEQGMYTTGEFEPETMVMSGHSPHMSWSMEEPLDEAELTVKYDTRDVLLMFENKGDQGRAGALLSLPLEEMKELAAAIYQAAWELENRPHPGESTDG